MYVSTTRPLAAVEKMPMLATTFCDVLFRLITPAMRAHLGVPDPPSADDDLGWNATYRCVRTRFHSLLDAIDPSPLPKNRRLTPEEFDAATAEHRDRLSLSDEVLAVRHERLAWTMNAILEASLDDLPPELAGQWGGSVAVDATNIPAFARPERRQPTTAKNRGPVVKRSADPDAGYYVRAEEQPGTARNKRQVRDAFWAYEATLVVTGSDDPTRDHAFPNLVVGMAPLHRPGEAVGENAIRALSSIAARGHPAGWLAGDRAYTNARSETFHLPARALGYKLVLDYRVDQLGVAGQHNGSILVEGAWYCPAMPEVLIDATADHRKGTIDSDTWRNRIEARRPYRLRPKGRPDREGHVRLLCPASDGAYTARCELKPASIKRTDPRTVHIPVTDALQLRPPVVCTQQSTTFPPEAGAKLLQELHYGSAEWSATYGTLRNGVEGFNGRVKDGAGSALADPSRRRIRGTAAQSIFAVLLIAATNLANIRSFLRNARRDAEGMFRRPRKRRRTTSSIQKWAPQVPALSGAPPP